MASSSRESLDDYAELSHRGSNPTAIMTQNLLVEIRQAVYEAQPKGSEEMNVEWVLLRLLVISFIIISIFIIGYPETYIVMLIVGWRIAE